MADLTKEYTDTKDRKHKVEHLILSDNNNSREQILEELFHALTRPRKRSIT